MKYACLVYADPSVFSKLTPAEGIRLTDDSIEYDVDLKTRGHYITSQALDSTDKAVTIRVRNGNMSSTDGPFAETKEFLAGFILIEARDLTEAVEIAGKIPMARVGSIEVRPYLHITHS